MVDLQETLDYLYELKEIKGRTHLLATFDPFPYDPNRYHGVVFRFWHGISAIDDLILIIEKAIDCDMYLAWDAEYVTGNTDVYLVNDPDNRYHLYGPREEELTYYFLDFISFNKETHNE